MASKMGSKNWSKNSLTLPLSARAPKTAEKGG
jgi:hypothetical protein